MIEAKYVCAVVCQKIKTCTLNQSSKYGEQVTLYSMFPSSA